MAQFNQTDQPQRDHVNAPTESKCTVVMGQVNTITHQGDSFDSFLRKCHFGIQLFYWFKKSNFIFKKKKNLGKK